MFPVQYIGIGNATSGKAARMNKIRQYIIDSYNGLYKIVLEPSMPTKQTIILLVVGLIIGMIWGYAIRPVQFYDSSPSQMAQGSRDQWVKLVAASYNAGMYGEEAVINLLQRVEQPGATVQRLLASALDGTVEKQSLQQIQDLANSAGAGTAAPQAPGIAQSLLDFIIPLILIIVITPILVLVWRLLFYSNVVAPILDKIRPKSEEEIQKRKELEAERKAHQVAMEAQKDMVVEIDEELGEPLTQKLSVYTKGRMFDDSFAIEDANDMFLGECGATIAKTLGDAKDLAAIEIWLFDKEDFVRTLTKVFVSEHAYNDPAIRSELEPKVENPATDIVVVKDNAKLVLETDALRMQATVKAFTYGSGGSLPPNSHFDSLSIEIAAWEKLKVGSSAPAVPPIPPMPGTIPASTTPMPVAPTTPIAPPPTAPVQPAAPQPLAPPPMSPSQPTQPNPAFSPPPAFNPPPAAPASSPADRGIRPLSPPPLQRPPAPPDDDDPFGGTGDFTPISNT